MDTLETRLADAYADAPDALKPILADAYKMATRFRLLQGKMREIATSAAKAVEYSEAP